MMLRPSYSTILFDLDGTLIDSTVDIASAANHARNQLNLPSLPVETIRSYIGDGVRALLERSLSTQDPKILDEAIELWWAHYRIHCLDTTRLYPGILEVLQSFHDNGVKMGIVTNKPLAASEIILSGLKIRELLQTVVGGDSTPNRKPHPEPLHFAVSQTGSPATQVLMVGDSSNDTLAAKDGGYASCGILWGIGDEASVRTAKPDYLISKPAELRKLAGF
jgi:phosphoglycolate phosphatase